MWICEVITVLIMVCSFLVCCCFLPLSMPLFVNRLFAAC